MTLNEYMDNFIFCLKRINLFSILCSQTDIEKDDSCILFTIPTVEYIKRNSNMFDHVSLYHYNLSFCEISDRRFEVLCHLHTKKFIMDACLFIVDLDDESVYKEWVNCEVSKSTPRYKSYIYDHLESIQQILNESLLTKEELIYHFDDDNE